MVKRIIDRSAKEEVKKPEKKQDILGDKMDLDNSKSSGSGSKEKKPQFDLEFDELLEDSQEAESPMNPGLAEQRKQLSPK